MTSIDSLKYICLLPFADPWSVEGTVHHSKSETTLLSGSCDPPHLTFCSGYAPGWLHWTWHATTQVSLLTIFMQRITGFFATGASPSLQMGYSSCIQSRTPRSSNRVHMLAAAVQRCSWRCTSLLSSYASCPNQRTRPGTRPGAAGAKESSTSLSSTCRKLTQPCETGSSTIMI